LIVWSHQTRRSCDPWWENETEWHRRWKNYFPNDFQEVIHVDEASGERHIADIKTVNNMIIEFQNSNIKPEEVVSREKFYGKMLWIVNGDKENSLNKENFNVSVGTGYTIESNNPVLIKFTWLCRLLSSSRFSKLLINSRRSTARSL